MRDPSLSGDSLETVGKCAGNAHLEAEGAVNVLGGIGLGVGQVGVVLLGCKPGETPASVVALEHGDNRVLAWGFAAGLAQLLDVGLQQSEVFLVRCGFDREVVSVNADELDVAAMDA